MVPAAATGACTCLLRFMAVLNSLGATGLLPALLKSNMPLSGSRLRSCIGRVGYCWSMAPAFANCGSLLSTLPLMSIITSSCFTPVSVAGSEMGDSLTFLLRLLLESDAESWLELSAEGPVGKPMGDGWGCGPVFAGVRRARPGLLPSAPYWSGMLVKSLKALKGESELPSMASWNSECVLKCGSFQSISSMATARTVGAVCIRKPEEEVVRRVGTEPAMRRCAHAVGAWSGIEVDRSVDGVAMLILSR